jgi:tRNA(Ile)-lysidine synthase
MSSIPRNEYTKWFDYDKIGTFPVFRTRQPGDYMCLYSVGKIQPGGGAAEETPGGCSNPATSPGNREMICKKLARIMLDAKIPAGIRDRVVLPFAGHEALWIPGLRMGDSCKVTSSTTRILEIHWNVRRERWHTVSKK